MISGFTPPNPKVQHITTLFRLISAGAIRIPSFQRGLVWQEREILELLESIYNGYPIGSLLFWETDRDAFHLERNNENPLPSVLEDSPPIVNWVIDGMQRLSSLYGVFNYDDSNSLSLKRFNVYFDASTEEFFSFHGKDALTHDLQKCMSMSNLFSPRKMLEDHKRFLTQSDSDKLIDQSLNLQTIFQEYQIPTVTISNRSIDEVVIMFERVNSTGVSLSVSEFMRAVTWTENFDLDEKINKATLEYGLDYFGISNETFTKGISIIAGGDISPESVSKLRDISRESLSSLIDRTALAFSDAILFLVNKFKILNNRFVPYEGQLLFLVKLFSREYNDDLLLHAEEWIWRISFSEGLKGKPESYMKRYLDQLELARQGNFSEIREQFTLAPVDLEERRFIFGSALSSSFASLFAINKAKNLITGDKIDYSSFMAGNNSAWFNPIVKHEHIKVINDRKMPSPKILANLVLIPPSDYAAMTRGFRFDSVADFLISLPKSDGTLETLQSQFLDYRLIEMLKEGNWLGFIHNRAIMIRERAREISSLVDLI